MGFIQRLDRVREEIERIEAERKSLVNRVDFATLNLTVCGLLFFPLRFLWGKWRVL
jgi:hypothetical protein